MSRVTENISLYAATATIISIGVIAYVVLAPIDKTAGPYRNALVDGCYQIFGPSVLDRPGCYLLREDLVFDKDDDYLVFIRSSDVIVDLNGKTVAGPGQSSTQSGIYIDGGESVTIKNGTLRGFLYGIRGEPDARGKPLEEIEISNVVVEDASLIGIKLIADKAVVIGNTISRSEKIEDRKYDYKFDLIIDASRCYYMNNKVSSHASSIQSNPLVQLDDSCMTK